MAARKQLCYVYRLFDGFETVYVGKGSGRRLQNQMAKYRLPGEILEECGNDDRAFEREIHWISVLAPTSNKLAGGNGGRCKPRRPPRILKEFADIERIGSRRYAARFLIQKLSDANCAAFGLSKIDMNRLREVAHGPRC